MRSGRSWNDKCRLKKNRSNNVARTSRSSSRLGVDPYPHAFARRHTISELVDGYGARDKEALEGERIDTVTSGRILAIRSFGKASFLVLSDGLAKIQVYVRQDALPPLDFQIFKLLDFGDWVGVEGHLFRTKTNELTIWASRLHFLAKCLLPLPEKWHGLTDVEIRYRQRYLDLIVNPDSRRVFETRSRIIAAIRAFMSARGYLEVETPMMQPIAGGALARPFTTHHNTLDMDLYLRIAPELYLKRLTVGGLEKVFEINRNFRNEGISTQHNPEFTMMEFYEAYSDYQALMTLTEELLSTVATQVVGDRRGHLRRASDFAEGAVRPAVAARGGARGRRDADSAATSPTSELRDRDAAAAPGAAAGPRRAARARRRKNRDRDLRGPVRGPVDSADLRLRLSDGSLAAVEAEARRSGHGRAVRAVRRRVRGRQRLQRAERPRRTAPAVRGPAAGSRRAAISKRTRWTTTTSGRSSTACRRRPARASASTGSSCC